MKKLLLTILLMMSFMISQAQNSSSNYNVIVSRSDPWKYVKGISRESPAEFWRTVINNNVEYSKLSKKMKSPTKTYNDAADRLWHYRHQSRMYFKSQLKDNILFSNEITDSLTKLFGLQIIDADAQFYFIKHNELNANCDPYGKMRIYTALAEKLTFPELIAVCAHEMAHHMLKHVLASEYASLKAKKRNKMWAEIGAGITVGAVATADFYATMNGAKSDTDWDTYTQSVYNNYSQSAANASLNFHYRYSREQEAEADIIAFRFLQWLGYDGYEFISVLLKIDDGKIKAHKYDDHPIIEQRIKLIEYLYKIDNKQSPMELVFENQDKSEKAFKHNCDLIFDTMEKFNLVKGPFSKEEFTKKMENPSFAKMIFIELKTAHFHWNSQRWLHIKNEQKK